MRCLLNGDKNWEAIAALVPGRTKKSATPDGVGPLLMRENEKRCQFQTAYFAFCLNVTGQGRNRENEGSYSNQEKVQSLRSTISGSKKQHINFVFYSSSSRSKCLLIFISAFVPASNTIRTRPGSIGEQIEATAGCIGR